MRQASTFVDPHKTNSVPQKSESYDWDDDSDDGITAGELIVFLLIGIPLGFAYMIYDRAISPLLQWIKKAFR